MKVDELMSKPVWQMTGEELMLLQSHNARSDDAKPQPIVNTSKKYMYGLPGIARLFGCSIPTACRIKRSGKIDNAVTQIGRKIIVDADLAFELAGKKVGGRK